MRDHETPEIEIERKILETTCAGFLNMVREKLSRDALEEANENDDPESYSQRFNDFLYQLIEDCQILHNNPLEIELRFKKQEDRS